ncbi:MAG: CAP domain-containing protein [Pseudomonadota bacterium]
MKRLFSLFMLGFAAVPGALACNMASADRSERVADLVEAGHECLHNLPEGFTFDTQMEADFIERVNDARRAEGLPTLTIREGLIAPARFHSLDMAYNDFFGHDSPAGRRAADRIAAFDRTLIPDFTAENVATESHKCTDGVGRSVPCGPGQSRPPSETLRHLHNGLMDSPGHRANILSEHATSLALGVVRRENGVFVTQLFANAAGELLEPAPLRAAPSSELKLSVTLPDWSTEHFAVVQDDIQIDLKKGRLPASLKGDFMLQVRGENKTTSTRSGGRIVQSCETIELPGPTLTVVPATGS